MSYENIITIVICCFILPKDGAIIPTKHKKGRLSEVEWTHYNFRDSEGQGTYAFGYDIDDPENNNIQFRNEEKLSNGSVVGRYGFLDPSGEVFLVNYIADEKGYRASFENTLRLSFLKPIQMEPDNPNGEFALNDETATEEDSIFDEKNMPQLNNRIYRKLAYT